MKIGLLGKKLGMTRVYDASGRSTAVTVIEAGGNVVVQTKTVSKEGYSALQVGYDDQKPQRLSKPALGHFRRALPPPRNSSRSSGFLAMQPSWLPSRSL